VTLLETGWLASFGRISYGFYLYHNFVPNPARLTRVEALFHGAGVPWWLQMTGVAVSFLIALALAQLSWRFIEEPILRRKSDWTARVVNAAPRRPRAYES
jgi:peptidoglycan/LPS O-acetylase OafA/YrhL